MRNRSVHGRLPRSIAICGVAVGLTNFVPGVHARTKNEESLRTPPSAEGFVISEVTVTGSRLPQPNTNLESISPVAVLGAEDIKVTGTQRVEDLLNNMPQVLAADSVNMGNLSTGTASINLRALGSNRTLVLVDGRRMPPGDPSNLSGQTSDLNNIPSALVKRVELLSGGASAVYGSDAIAGVVNFILMKDFQGFRIDAQSSVYQHTNDNGAIRGAVGAQAAESPSAYRVAPKEVWEGSSSQISFIAGLNVPNGNITAYATYLDTSKVSQARYDHGSCSLASGASFNSCVGSITSASGQFLAFDPVSGDLLANPLTVDQTSGDFRDFNLATDTFNGAPYNLFQRPDERYNVGAFGHYEFSEAADAYLQLAYMEDKTSYQIPPSGIFGSLLSGIFDISCANPLLSTQQRDTLCAGGNSSADMIIFRRNVEGGPELIEIEHRTYSAVAGVRGKFGQGWGYDAYLQYGETELHEPYSNDISRSRLPLAMDPVVDPATGNIVCRAVLTGEDSACVPYNLFTPGGITPAALAYIQTGGVEAGAVHEVIANASLNGDLGQYGLRMPWANAGVGVAVGAEYRRQSLNYHPDAAFTSGDLTGAGIRTPQRGGYDVKELFSEARLPLIEDRFGASRLAIEGGYRYSQYSEFDAKTHKLGVDWAPVPSLRFRGSYQHAVRAPNIYELFTPTQISLDGVTDPCAGVTPTATPEQCAHTGVTASQYGNILESNFGYNGRTGGNPLLGPEKADTVGVGIVVTPSFADNLGVSVDWFDIALKGAVSTIGADLILDRCLESGSSFFCSKVHRAPGSASLWLSDDGFVDDTVYNVGQIKTTGIDTEVRYRVELGRPGSVDFNLFATWTDTWDLVPLSGAAATKCAGFYGVDCGLPIPDWRHTLRTSWTTPWDVTFTLSWNHISAVKLGTEDDPATGPPSDLRLPAVDYFDLAATWRPLGRYALRAGVNNITDKDPPLIGRASLPFRLGSGNTFPTVYDSLGRYLFLGLTVDFGNGQER